MRQTTIIIVITTAVVIAPRAHDGAANPFADSGPAKQLEVMKTEPRHALVIGNSSYATSPLRNPKHDAELVARTLEAVGFSVVTVVDADQKAMRRAVQEFGAQIAQGGVGLFYYAGHALQVNGRNYMIPVDAAVAGEADVEIESVDVAAVLAKMSTAHNRMNIVILDACRNNPFARSFRSATRGLAMTDAPEGTLIAYATAPGDVAADGEGDNSPYSDALARFMRVRGVEIGELFRGVRTEVRRQTKDAQTPWESSSLEGRFYFVLPDALAAVVEAPPSAPVAGRASDIARRVEPPPSVTAAKTILVRAMVGVGAAVFSGRTEQVMESQSGVTGPAPSLTVEVGYHVSQRTNISLGLKLGLVMGANIAGHATAAPAISLRLQRAILETGLHWSAGVGVGLMRHPIGLDAPVGAGMDVDTGATGPLFLGGGIAYLKPLHPSFSLFAGVDVWAGVPVAEVGAVKPAFGVPVDLNLGLRASF